MSDEIFDCDVVVVGAGLSGLACAYLLNEAGLDVIVLEAADRPGGRIHSVRHQGSGAYLADLGPTWVWPKYQPLINPWLERLELETFAQFAAGDAVFDRGPDQPVHRQPDPGQDGIRRISGGPQALITSLLKRLPAGCVRTGHCVTEIDGAAKDIVVRVRIDDEPVARSFNAHQAVMAIPLRIAYETIDWSGMLDQHVLAEMAATPTWMATQAKMVAVYHKPFWREAGLSGFVTSQSGPLTEIHDHCSGDGERAALFGFIGWPHEIRRLRDSELKSEIIVQLVRCFGNQAGNMSAIHIEDWANNRTICSDLDLTTPPTHPEVTSELLRASHYQDRLFFSVAECAEQSPGLIEGAFAAAQQTATRLMAAL